MVSSFTSSKRPPGYAFYNCRGRNFQRLGTGFVQYVYRNDTRTGKTCPCPECVSSQTPHVEWAKVKVRTATHVVFDDAEARNTVAELFYDDDGDKGAVKRLYGDNVRFGALQGDWCDMRCVTHDVELVDYLKDTWGMWRWLETKINQKYSDQDHRLAVVVSGRCLLIILHINSLVCLGIIFDKYFLSLSFLGSGRNFAQTFIVPNKT